MLSGLYDEAQTWLTSSYDIVAEADDEFEKGWVAGNLAELFSHRNELITAHSYLEEALAQSHHLGDPWLQIYTLRLQADLFRRKGDVTAVENTFAQSKQLWQDPTSMVEPRTILAAAYLAAGQTENALKHINIILDFLVKQGGNLQVDDPFFIYLTCYQALAAVGDGRAIQVLEVGYSLLNQRANHIRDKKQRASYIENVAANQQLITIYKAQKK